MIILIAFVPIVSFLLGMGNVSVPFDTLFLSVIMFVVIPLIGGIITRYIVAKKKGIEYFENVFTKKFDGITTVGLLLTLIISWRIGKSTRNVVISKSRKFNKRMV